MRKKCEAMGLVVACVGIILIVLVLITGFGRSIIPIFWIFFTTLVVMAILFGITEVLSNQQKILNNQYSIDKRQEELEKLIKEKVDKDSEKL